MAKNKKDLDPEKYLRKAKGELKKLKHCNFEEFREVIIDLAEQMMAGQFMKMEWLAEERQGPFNEAVKHLKHVKAASDRDFKIAEKNFQRMFKVIDDFEKRVSKAEATALVSLMYTCAGVHAMGKRRLITDTTLNEGLKLIPRRVKKHITDTLEMEPKRFNVLLEEALKATAA